MFKKNFEAKLKLDLILESESFIKNFLKNYNLPSFENIESNCSFKHSKTGWKEFYPEINENDNEENNSQYPFNVKYGKTFSTKIFYNNHTEYYEGEVNISNKRHGYGTLININGENYKGFFFNDKKNGWGQLIDKNLNIFQGLFINDTLTGRGQIIYSNGDFYKGEISDFQKHGIGYEKKKNSVYHGNFDFDKKNGIGKFTYLTTNDKYEGHFKDDEITGIGKLTWEKGESYEGNFIKGKMNGPGIYYWKDGSEFNGNYRDNIKYGKGKFKWKNGKIYEGDFCNGVLHGKGIIIYPDGRPNKDVVFENGKIAGVNLGIEKDKMP